MRVYELAKQLGIDNRDLIPELKAMGYTVKSHSSALEEDIVQKVRDRFAAQAKAGALSRVTEPAGDSLRGEGARKEAAMGKGAGGSGEARPMGKTSPAIDDHAQKADKKRILFKRKKTDEEIAAESAVTSSSFVEPAAPLAAPAQPDVEPPPDLTHATPPPVQRAPVSVPPMSPTMGMGEIRPAAPVATRAPAAVVAPLPRPAPPDAGGAGLDKKKGLPETVAAEEVGAAKDKLKKGRRPGRAREDEDPSLRQDLTRWQDLRAIPVHRREDRSRHAPTTSVAEITKPRKKIVKLTAGLTVKEFAELIGQRPADIMRKLMDMGQMLTLNQSINLDAAQLIADGVGVKAEVAVEKQAEDLLEEVEQPAGEDAREPRPPVVTIMGHVDHGKTSLLDAIRQAKVAEGEAGGITQHIGAYTVQVHGKKVTFLDTPGHEAFTSMRARGAKVTDLVVLVVAADDGVMPQTVEAINHATAANVPIIVALNKIDKPDANPDRVKHALAEHNLIPEQWGGQTIFVEVSAKKKQNLDVLLEMILLQAEVLELRADPKRRAKGTVVEAKLDRGRGPVATVLVQGGTLRVGDAFVVGPFSGKVRALLSDTGAKVTEAGPSMPVEVIGLPGVPAAGDPFVAVSDERVAREIAESRMSKQRTAELAVGSSRVTLDDLYARIKEGDVKELSLVIKSDVQGSAEALSDAVEKLPSGPIKLQVIHRGVGGITESDVLLASASRAIIIGFNIRPESKATALAEREGVDIRLYTIIYDALADIKAAMEGMLEPTLKERVLGRVEVRQVFTISKVGTIAGCYVTEGTITRQNAGVRVIRDHVMVYQGKMSSLRRFKDDVREVQQGYECGIGVENFKDLKSGDILEVFTVDKIAGKL
jgi:translation initiation factor IF-2